jgi:hypothetical protein
MRLEIHKAMGVELDAAKHLQRRKEGGLSDGIKATAAAFSSAPGRQAFLHEWYGLDED